MKQDAALNQESEPLPLVGGVAPSFGVLCNIDGMGDFKWYLLPNSIVGAEEDATSFAKRLAYTADEETVYIVVEITETGYKRIGDGIRGDLQL